MEWIKLIGIVIIVIGFIYKLDTIATVVLASLVTALVSGVSLVEFLEILGREFSNQRVLTIFMVTLPLVGLSETFGLKQCSIDLIQRTDRRKFLYSLFLFSGTRQLLCHSYRRAATVCKASGSTHGTSSGRVTIR